MANHKSSLKRIKQTAVRTERNRAYRTKMRNIIKAVVQATSKEDAEAAFVLANKELHKMVTKGILKKGTASRKVSRLALFVNKLNNQ
jgi:small subunit ribosomal protein S20